MWCYFKDVNGLDGVNQLVVPDTLKAKVPYTAKLSRGKTFAVFTVFQPIAKVFPLNHLPCTVHNGMDMMYRENFPVNSAFCAQPRKFSSSKVLSYTVLCGVHEGIGGSHHGVEKTVVKLKERFYWPGHYSNVQNWCATCSSCAARKTAQPHRNAGLQPVTVGYPLQMVAVDIMGPFTQTVNENSHMLVAQNYFTK